MGNNSKPERIDLSSSTLPKNSMNNIKHSKISRLLQNSTSKGTLNYGLCRQINEQVLPKSRSVDPNGSLSAESEDKSLSFIGPQGIQNIEFIRRNPQ